MRSRVDIKIYLLILIIFTILYSSLCSAKSLVLLLGDSLSTGYGFDPQYSWTHSLEKRLQEKYPAWRFVNASIAGDTSSNGLERLPDLLKEYQPSIVILELGGNDGLRGLSTVALKNNLAQMILLSRKHQANVLLLGLRLPPNYGYDYVADFEAVYPLLYRKYKVKYVHHFLKGVAGYPELMQKDGVHPNAKAQVKLLRNVWPQLKELLDQMPVTKSEKQHS